MLDAGYSGLEKLLHRLALGSRDIAEMSFRIDQSVARPDADWATGGKHVFVSGLARAGTTIIMRRLYATGAFRSLTYRDMPFVLAPNIWKRLRRDSGKTGRLSERVHGDGIEVGFDSPESLDEVFWRVFCGGNYIHQDHLCPHSPGGDVIADYRSYVGAILVSDEKQRRRYLSKNNNNILRLPAILNALPEAVVLVPFRQPVAHALSLQAQHLRFCKLQAEDAFIRSYMGWLAHHEFGLDHRPFRFPVHDAADAEDRPEDLSYWLKLWCRAHEWLLGHDDPRIRFVSYDALCENPAAWTAVAEMCEVSPGPVDGEKLEMRPAKHAGPIPRALEQRCTDAFRQLVARANIS